LNSRVRTDARVSRQSPGGMGWLLVAFAAAAGFLLLVNAILDRSAHTAGPTPASDGAPLRSDAELKAELAAELDGSSPPVASGQSFAETAAPPAMGASMVYRCVGAAGDVSFQSQPCTQGQQTTRVIHAAPERERPRYSPGTNAVSNNVQVVNTINNTVHADDRERRRRACDAARRNRDATLRRVGLARTYDLLQKLDAQVYEACKGL